MISFHPSFRVEDVRRIIEEAGLYVVQNGYGGGVIVNAEQARAIADAKIKAAREALADALVPISPQRHSNFNIIHIGRRN